MSINWGKDFDLLLHDFVTLGVVAAGIFVKNPNSRAHAATIIDAVQKVVLPMADDALSALSNQATTSVQGAIAPAPTPVSVVSPAA